MKNNLSNILPTFACEFLYTFFSSAYWIRNRGRDRSTQYRIIKLTCHISLLCEEVEFQHVHGLTLILSAYRMCSFLQSSLPEILQPLSCFFSHDYTWHHFQVLLFSHEISSVLLFFSLILLLYWNLYL